MSCDEFFLNFTLLFLIKHIKAKTKTKPKNVWATISKNKFELIIAFRSS